MSSVADPGEVPVNDVQHKKNTKKNTKDMVTIIRHGGLGHEVQEPLPFIATFSIYFFMFFY